MRMVRLGLCHLGHKYIKAWAQFEKGKRFFCNMIKFVKQLLFNCSFKQLNHETF